MLSEVREDAIVLTWGQYPVDLDSRLRCPDGSVVGTEQAGDDMDPVDGTSNDFAEVSVDTSESFGPETMSIRRWTDISPNSKSKIGGHYEFYVNWNRDKK